jgi:hypothetical protein
MRTDGGEQQLLAEMSSATNASTIWQLGDYDLLTTFHYDDSLLHVDVESGAVNQLLEIEDGQFGQLWYEPSFSNDGRYMAMLATVEDVEWYLFIYSTDVEEVVRFQNTPCLDVVRAGMWWGNNYYFFDEGSDGLCQLKRFEAGERVPTVVQTFVENARWMRFIRTKNQVWIDYQLDTTHVISNLDGSVVFPMEISLEEENLAWTELPLRETDNPLMIVSGLICISLTVMLNLALSRRQ